MMRRLPDARRYLIPILVAAASFAACSREQRSQPGAGASAASSASSASSANAASGASSPSAAPSADTQAAATAHAPDTLRVRFETSKGTFVVDAYRAWAPNGVDRFYQLVRSGYYDGDRFFRVISGFMVQFGISGDPNVTKAWRDRRIPDDPGTHSNARGTISFATQGPNTRTTQLFINFVDNTQLDRMGFTPIGQVTQGMNVVDSLYAGYGEGAPQGEGPDQMRIMDEGNAYLQRSFPKLDYIVKATVVK